MQLSAAVTAQVEATRAGLDMLNRAHAALLRLRENFARIDQLCAECEQLVDCHDKIQLLSVVHYNLRKTLQARMATARGAPRQPERPSCHARNVACCWAQDVEAIAALPVEAAEAEEMLQNDTNLLQARSSAC
jgi:exocyst complex component 3